LLDLLFERSKACLHRREPADNPIVEGFLGLVL
jgi:hypothetical protein